MELRRAASGRGPAALNPSQDAPLFLERYSARTETNGIAIDQLERFLRHPVRAFLRERLNVSLRDRTRDFEDAIPIKLDALEQWQIADRLLAARLGGASPEACRAVEIDRGELPPGQLADPVLDAITGPVEVLVREDEPGDASLS